MSDLEAIKYIIAKSSKQFKQALSYLKYTTSVQLIIKMLQYKFDL